MCRASSTQPARFTLLIASVGLSKQVVNPLTTLRFLRPPGVQILGKSLHSCKCRSSPAAASPALSSFCAHPWSHRYERWMDPHWLSKVTTSATSISDFAQKNPVSYSGVLGLPRTLLSEKCSVSCKDSKGWIMLHILWLIFSSIIISVKLKISLAHTTQQISKEQVVASCNWNWYIMPYLPSRISDGCTRQILSLCTSIWSLKVYRYNTLSWK